MQRCASNHSVRLWERFWYLWCPTLCGSTVWCSAAGLHLTVLDFRISIFLAGGVLECNLAHWRTLAVLCTLFKIKSNPMHPLSSAWPLPRVPSRVTSGVLVAHRHSLRLLAEGLLGTAEPSCPSQCLLGMIIVTLCLMVWGWQILRAEPRLSC